jgi:hypothetical protein
MLLHQPKDLNPKASTWIGKAFIAHNALEIICKGGGCYHTNPRTCIPTPASGLVKLLLQVIP